MPPPLSKLVACESLTQEHEEMRLLLQDLELAMNTVNSQSLPEIIEPLMQRIEVAMNTHFACEEAVLFKAVEPYHSMVLMEREHENLVKLRDQFITKINGTASFDELVKLQHLGHHFIQEMRDHITREDKGIFPTCEKTLSPSEKEEVVQAMTKIRDDAIHTPAPSITRPDKTYEVFKIHTDNEGERSIMSERIMMDDSQEVKHITIKAGEALSQHWAPKPALILCLKGQGTFSANGVKEVVSHGTLIKMSAQLQHAFSAETTCHLLLLLESKV